MVCLWRTFIRTPLHYIRDPPQSTVPHYNVANVESILTEIPETVYLGAYFMVHATQPILVSSRSDPTLHCILCMPKSSKRKKGFASRVNHR